MFTFLFSFNLTFNFLKSNGSINCAKKVTDNELSEFRIPTNIIVGYKVINYNYIIDLAISALKLKCTVAFKFEFAVI